MINYKCQECDEYKKCSFSFNEEKTSKELDEVLLKKGVCPIGNSAPVWVIDEDDSK